MDIYNINQYSENELFNILDINNPTDNELEAKILSQIKQYSRDDTETSKKLLNFYNDMYDRFFGEDDNDINEHSHDQLVPSPNNNNDSKQIVEPFTNLPDETSQYISKTESITTIIIDSQYRNPNSSALSTNFTFNLSTTVKNIVTMRLDSITIPMSYYNVTSESNSFSIIETDRNYTDRYVITIPKGNYNNENLITTIKQSILKLSETYTDVSFGNTNIELSSSDKDTNKVNIIVDITKHFGENIYKILYNPISVLNQSTNEQINDSIFNFLGYTQNAYNFSSVVSNKTLPSMNSQIFYTSPLYLLTTANNFFTVVQYVPNTINNPPYTYVDTENITILNTYIITLSLATSVAYSRNDLQYVINRELSNNTYFSNSGLFILETENNLNSFYFLNIFLNRYTTLNQENSKIAVIFPQDPQFDRDIWVGPNSAFNFDASINELSIITSDVPATTQTTPENFYIGSNSKILIRCNKQYYDLPGNNYTVTVPNGNYLINDYISAINQGVSSENDNSINSQNPNGVLLRSASFINPENNLFSFGINIKKLFDQNNFEYKLGNFWTQNTTYVVNDSNQFYVSVSADASYNVTENNNVVLIIKPRASTVVTSSSSFTSTFTPISPDLSFNVYLPEGDISNNDQLAYQIQLAFNNLDLTSGSACIYNSNSNQLSFTMFILDELTTNDYDVTFVDASDSWVNYLNITQNVTIDLSDSTTALTGMAIIYGSEPIDFNTINITSNNNEIIFKPNSNKEADTLKLKIQNGIYNRTTLIDNINIALQIEATSRDENITQNSYFSIVEKNGYYYTQFYSNINQNYTSKDYSLLFYEDVSNCVNDTRIKYNQSLNSLGSILGYTNIIYNIGNYSSVTNSVSIESDSEIEIDDNQYFFLSIDDFTNSSTNGNIVTAVSHETKIPLPSYVKKSGRTRSRIFIGENGEECVERISGITTNNQIMTANELYSAEEILNAYQNSNQIISNLAESSKTTYTNQLNKSNINNILAVIPIYSNIVTSGSGSNVIQYSSTQSRTYFGPVDISRMNVKLLDSKGNLVNLNGRNWSSTLSCTINQ